MKGSVQLDWGTITAIAIIIVLGLLLILFSGRFIRWLDRKWTEWYPWMSKITVWAYDEKTKRPLGWRLLGAIIWVWRVIGLIFLAGGILILVDVIQGD